MMMRPRKTWIAPLVGLLLATEAQAQGSTTLDGLLDAAGRGEVAAAAQALDSTADANVRAVLGAGLAAARLQAGVAGDPALRRLAENGDPALRRAALTVLTNAAFADGDYAEAARAGRLMEAALAENGQRAEAEAAGRTWQLATLLIDVPAQRVEGALAPGSTAARSDKVGLPRIDIAVNGVAQDAVFDTGANLSVLSAETARRMGVEIRESETRVGNGVDGTVPVRIGIADRFEIAGTTLRHVVFLIIDDAQLTFPAVPGGYDIKAIVGLPVLRALGRIRLEQAGRFLVQPPAQVPHASTALTASGNDMFVKVGVDGAIVPLHLDTGAGQTALTARYAAAHPEAMAALPTRSVQSASAGGTRMQQTATWPNAPIALGEASLSLPELSVALPAEGPEPRFNGTLGSDVLQRFDGYTIDFAAMRLELGAPVN